MYQGTIRRWDRLDRGLLEPLIYCWFNEVRQKLTSMVFIILLSSPLSLVYLLFVCCFFADAQVTMCDKNFVICLTLFVSRFWLLKFCLKRSDICVNNNKLISFQVNDFELHWSASIIIICFFSSLISPVPCIKADSISKLNSIQVLVFD